MSLTDATAAELLPRLQAREFTAQELVQACLERIEGTDGEVQSFLTICGESALAAAAGIDRRRAAGQPVGPLAGLPVAVKDVLCVRDERTTCGSKILANYRPPYDATLVARLRAADAIVIGKTNMDEFAMGSSTENSAYQTTRNPWQLDRVPGGSSGGSATSLAARQVPLAIGTDTGGSIRQPASFCGVVGLKPTYGRVSRYGLVAYASSLDQAGPMARTAEDAAILLNTLAGHDPLDTTSAPLAAPDYTRQLAEPLTSWKIGVVRSHFGAGLQPQVAQAVEQAIATYRELGAKIVDVELPHNHYGIAAYYVIAPCEASSNLARYDGIHYGYRTDERALLEPADRESGDSTLLRLYRGSRTEGFGLEVKRRIMLGTFALSAGYQDRYYLKAMQVRRLIRADYEAAFAQADLLLDPTAPTTAYRLGEKLADPLSMYLGDLYTVGANLAGLPAISVPCGFDGDGLPIGFQLHAPPFEEARLLQAAHQYQSVTAWHTRRPTLP